MAAMVGRSSRMTAGWGRALFAACLAWGCFGCDPKCREPEPIHEVRERMRDRIDDRMDDADADDAQVAKVKKAFEATLPALRSFRDETEPREREAMAELRRDAPDRQKLARIIDLNVAAWERYARTLVDAMLVAHPAFSHAQRKAMADKASEPSERFEGSFWLDRAVDYFLMKIDATPEQTTLVIRIKGELLARGRKLRQQVDVLRAEAFHELAQDRPDKERVYGTIARGGGLARALFRDLAGYYLLLSSKLTPRQRVLLKAEMVRFEPCARPSTTQSSSAGHVPGA
jgi:hypothetical protein